MTYFRKYDVITGQDGKHVLIGEQALSRCGLTSLHTVVVQCSTLCKLIHGAKSEFNAWYFNPMADDYSYTKPSPVCSNILEPTQERALVEYMLFHDYFDEGILIEGIQTYGFQHDNDWSKLYPVAKYFGLSVDKLEYWINEALNDFEV